MKEVLIWEQAGLKNVIFSQHILSIQENSNSKDYCDISVTYSDEPIAVSISVDEVLKRLDITS